MTRAYLFPGQGAQTIGMGRDLAEGWPAARAVFDEVDAALGEKLSAVIWEGDIADLTLTENAQPALMATSLAAVRALEAEGVEIGAAAFVAGHSLGEYSALCAAGSLSVADAARLLRLRGAAMQAAVPVGVGAMAAVLGLDFEAASAVAAEAAEGEVCEAANDNDPAQVVLSGHKAAVERACEIAKARGAKRALMLPVSAPFHCALMQPRGGGDGGGAGGGGDRAALRAAGVEREGGGGGRPRGDPAAAGGAGDRPRALARERGLHGRERRDRDGRGRRGQGAERDGPADREGDRGAGGERAGRCAQPRGSLKRGRDMFDLTGKSALVTGASGGIGGAIARALHAQGAVVALSGTRVGPLEELAGALGERVHVLPCDLSDGEAVAALPKRAAEAMGAVDILVNNAGITRDQLFMRMSDADWDAVIAVNLTSVMRLSRGVLRGMMKARWGRIVNISSVVGVTGNAGQANYTAAKAGVIGMSKSLAAEVAGRGITVNCVAPGFIATPMTEGLTDEQKAKISANIPAGRMGTPEEIAASVVYLAAEEAGYVTGQTLHVNGGLAMI